MELRLDSKATVRDIQLVFNLQYPYMKLEFFALPKANSFFNAPGKVSPDTVLGTLTNKLDTPVTVSIDKFITVFELEADLRNKAGLNVQVFRKTGRTWIETILTRDWSIDRQNLAGEMVSIHILSSKEPQNKARVA